MWKNGRLANRMFQYMFARELCHRLGRELNIVGDSLPEWGIELAEPVPPPKGSVPAPQVVRGLNFNVDALATALRQGVIGPVILQGWPMRLEYYRGPENYAGLFTTDEPPSYEASDDEVLFHVRSGDIIDGHHPLYFPLPPTFYSKVVEQTGLRPVFIGELDDNPYVAMLRRNFPQAKFLPPAGVVADFQSLRHARHVAVSISSFSWLATWLSTRAETIHFPVGGLLYPFQSGPNLLPVDDMRYRFYAMTYPEMEERRAMGAENLFGREVPVYTIDRSRLFGLVRKALLEPIPEKTTINSPSVRAT